MNDEKRELHISLESVRNNYEKLDTKNKQLKNELFILKTNFAALNKELLSSVRNYSTLEQKVERLLAIIRTARELSIIKNRVKNKEITKCPT